MSYPNILSIVFVFVFLNIYSSSLIYADANTEQEECISTAEETVNDNNSRNETISPEERKKRMKSIDNKICALMKKKKKLYLEMHKLRVKLIKNEPELKKLHEKIVELYKKLAIMIAQKKGMRILLKKEEEIDDALDTLSRELDKLKK